MPARPEPAAYVLQSRRLRFRPLREADLDALFSVFGNPLVMRYFPAPWSRQECAAALQRNIQRYAADGFGLWALERIDTGEFIGDCGLVRQQLPSGPEVEVGYHLHPESWGFGYATEAANRCLTYAFDALKLSRVISLIRPENGPSRRVADRNGLRVTGEVEWTGSRHLIFAITQDEWLARRR